MRRVNSAETFTSYANLEIRLVVHSFKPNLNERLNPTRYPINLFRDDDAGNAWSLHWSRLQLRGGKD